MKLKGFSILELMVAIILSGMVIGTAYSVYTFTHQQLYHFSSIKTEIRNYYEFSEVLNRDVENASKIIKRNEYEIELQQLGRNVTYEFKNDFVLRYHQNNLDTFFFAINQLELNVLNEIKEELLVDYIRLNIADEGKNKTLSIYKNYGAIIYFEED